MQETLLMKFSLSLKTNKAEFANVFNNLFEILLIKCEK